MPNIYFYCEDLNYPIGGYKTIYRHASTLSHAGFSAFILHTKPLFRFKWFNSTAKIKSRLFTRKKSIDIVVLSETYGAGISDMFKGKKKVIFNQNAYHTFNNYPLDRIPTQHPYAMDDVLSIICVSQDSVRYVESLGIRKKVYLIPNSINSSLFNFSDTKRCQICYMPRKNIKDVIQVLNILQMRNSLNGFKLVSIENRTEGEVAKIFKESMFFLSFGHPEGFGLPPAEAMACGCVVIGYDGQGGKEFFMKKFCRPVLVGDILGYVEAVEDTLEEYRKTPETIMIKGRKASEYILKKYSINNEEEKLIQAWNDIIKHYQDSPV